MNSAPLSDSQLTLLERLLQIPAPPEPSDFAVFWQDIYRRTLQIPLNIERRQIESVAPNLETWEIEFDSWGGVRIGGWLTVPKKQDTKRAVVVGHGYGGRSAPVEQLTGAPAAAIFPCARGFDRSAHPLISNDASKHVLHGIESRDTYSHLGCVVDGWCAASALLELFPHLADDLHYQGGSFGGGIGTLMLPWDARFKRAYLDVPSFGNHPLRVQIPCTGSGEAVRLYRQNHSGVMEVLAYFDSALAAKHVHIPVLVAAALSDPAVPPPGQFTVYNSLAGPKELFVRQTGHPNTTTDDMLLEEQLSRWFAD